MPLKLQFPVYTLGRRQLLPPGATLTRETLGRLADSGRKGPVPTTSLLKFGTVRRDLLGFLRQDAYRVIFGDLRSNAALMELMESVRVSRPVLEILSYFRKNDLYTYRHVLRVFALSVFLARNLESGHRDLVLEGAAGPLHDIGKICVPLPILRKTTPLRRSERALLEHHAIAGYVLLSHYLKDFSRPAVKVALEHHERRDGSGYPRGIRLRNRLVEIVVACDVYDALISARPYRRDPYDNRTALEEMSEMADRGSMDLGIVKALVSHNRKDRPDPRECKVSDERRGTPPDHNLYGLLLEDESPGGAVPA
ncbi:MAG: HD domain-containing protein [Deltaproteobacteria bacterium]|nr:HD domain-containing protein [Deltaproteobacteria bacterium]